MNSDKLQTIPSFFTNNEKYKFYSRCETTIIITNGKTGQNKSLIFNTLITRNFYIIVNFPFLSE